MRTNTSSLNELTLPAQTKPRVMSGNAAKLVAIAAMFLGSATAAIDPAGAAGYPYPNAPDCNEYGPGGCVADKWHFYQGQCTSWVAGRLNVVNGIEFDNSYKGVHWGNANNWDNAARSAGITVNKTPARGAIAQWNNKYHVAYVERVNSDGSLLLSDQNSDLHNKIRTGFTVRPGDSWWPENFIHIKDIGNAPKPVSSMPVGKTRTIDDPRITGPARWLTRRTGTSSGYQRDYTITQSGAGRSVTNTATWTFRSIPKGSVVRVQAYVPTREAVARVVYQAFDGSRYEKGRTINQQASYGWVTLYYIKVDSGTLTIKVPDNLGGASQYGRLIGFDAIRITRTR